MPTDPFHIPDLYKTDGWSYQWVRKSVCGQDDTGNIATMENAGWRWVPKNTLSHIAAYHCWDKGPEWAEYSGLVLMSRPDYLTMRAQADIRKKSFEQANRWKNGASPEMRPRITPAVLRKKPNVFQRIIKAIKNEDE